MALPGTDAERRTYLQREAESDPTFLFQEAGVPLDLQVRLVAAGYKNVIRFTGYADQRADLRTALAADFQIDPQVNGAADRAVAAAVVAAWESAQEYRKRDLQLRAEAKSLQIVRPATTQERTTMRRAVEAAYGPLPSKEVPSSEYLRAKLEEVENDEPFASPLDEVSSLETAETQSLTASLDPTGRLRISKAKAKGRMPTTTEELRLRLRVEANTWLFLAVKFANRPWLQGLDPYLFSRYTDYLLGEKVYELRIPKENAMESLQTPWPALLHYDYECRKSAFRRVREEGLTLADALRQAMADPELKEVHFTSPIALAHRTSRGEKRSSDAASSNGGGPSKRQRTSTKAVASKGKGKGNKGGGKDRPNSRMGLTPDGRQICFAYNTANGCNDPNCARVHICRARNCGGDHPITRCTRRAATP